MLRKRTDTNSQWKIIDTARDSYNLSQQILYANLSNAEAAPGSDAIDITANGFKCRGTDTDTNANGGTYIYAAFAESPFRTSLAR